MAGYLIRLERMCPIKFRRKPLLSILILILIITMFYKGIMLLSTPPKLYTVAIATLKENYVIKEDRDDPAECTMRMRDIQSYIVHLKDVIVNPTKVQKMQRDSNHVKLIKGFFTVPCIGDETSLTSSLFYGSGSYFQQWASSVEVTDFAKNEESEIGIVEGYTFAVKRQDTENAYLRIIDMYNTYLTMRMLRRPPKDNYVVFIDTYPEHPTDTLWNIAFGEATQIGEIHDTQRFQNFIWVIPSRLGPVASLDLPLPYLDDFRHHVVTSGGAVTSDDVSCQSLRLTVLTYGEESPTEDRSISNMAEIIQRLHKEFPQYEIMTTSSEAVNMHSHIQTLAKTDILIGVHGNDLANTVFLHRGSGLIELFPYRLTSDTTFQQLAEWSNVYYLSWYNPDLMSRESEPMSVDQNTIISLVNGMKKIICS